MLLTFNATIRRIEVSVDVIDDSVFEGDEDFIGTLTLVSDSQRVAIDHGSAVATIVDDESGLIDCLLELLTVHEVWICIKKTKCLKLQPKSKGTSYISHATRSLLNQKW